MFKGNEGKKRDNVQSRSPEVPPQLSSEIAGDSQRTSATDSNESATLDQTICEICNLNKPGEWVVQCDECDHFFHYKCIGFNDLNKDDPWSCPECAVALFSSTVTRPSEVNVKSQNPSLRVSTTANEDASSNQMGRTDFQARSLNLRQEFEKRFDDLVTSYQSSGRREVLNSMKQTEGNALVKNVSVANSSGEPTDPTKTQSSRQFPGSTAASIASKTQSVSANVPTNQRFSDRDLTSLKSTDSRYQSVPQEKRQTHTLVMTKTKVPSLSSKVSKSSSQRLRDIEFQRLQEEFEMQTKIDNERLALERKALELKELRQKKLIEGKYRAMEEIITVNSGSSAHTKAETRKSATMNAHSKVSAQSELVESWILEQRKQNYRPETITDDIDPIIVSQTLGVDLSVPMNERELSTLNRRQPVEIYPECQGETNFGSDAGTFIIEGANQYHPPLTSVTPTYQWNQSNQQNRTYDGRVVTTQSASDQLGQNQRHGASNDPNGNSQNQPFNSNRISWNLNNQRPKQQSTRIATTTSQANTPGTGASQFINNQSNQLSVTAQHQLNGSDKQRQTMLMASQIASRHSMPKDLPLFNGHPQEWPQFIKRFHNTTSLCGYGDAENLERLNKCLKGKAREIVESLLVMPECVDEIIETLREKFGRPELIASAALAKVRAEPPIKPDKLESLSDFGYKVRNACNVIESMGLHYYLYNPELIQDIIGKLPCQIKIEWARRADAIQSKNQNINLRTIAEWLHKLSRTLNQITTLDLDSLTSDKKTDKRAETVKSGYLNVHDANPTTSEVQQEHPKCASCSSSCINVGECSKFKSLSTDAKWKCVTDNNLCRKCLTKHGRKTCPAKKFPCGVNGCELKHNLLLHNEERHSQFRTDKLNSEKQRRNSTSGESNTNDKQGPNPPPITPKQSNTHQVFDEAELFRIVPVTLYNDGKTVETFAFLDEGSSYTLMEKATADQLNAVGTPETICLLWTNGIHRQEETRKVNVEISGTNDTDMKYQMRSVNVVDDLGLSPQTIDPDALQKKFKYLERIPLQKYTNAIPTILIGMRHIRLTTPLETIEGEENQPIASRSRIGWTVYGPTDNNGAIGYANHHKVTKCPCSDRDDDLHQIIKDHFTIENFGVSVNSVDTDSKENIRALEMLKKFTVRKGNRFETRLLWKNESYILPDSYDMARKRLACVENKGAEVVKTINEIIENYISKGYASKLTPVELEKKHPRTFYLPIFTVSNPKKPGKIRPVFDAAATVKGTSLNSVLLTGPDMLSSLVDILRRFREHQIAVVGDIEEMFYRVLVNEKDRHSQRFLWRNGDRNSEPDIYEFNVMTFGSKCSPSSAQFVKNVNAAEYELEFPVAANSIIKNHYVDDMLDGAESVKKAIKLINDVKFIHSKAGFNIRNFKSNSEEVLEAIGEPNVPSKVNLEDENSNIERVLGMYWETRSDCFMFSLKYAKVAPEILQGKKVPTKRELLRLTMSLFDPLGLIAYYVIHARILLQNVWRTQITWDEKLPDELVENWDRWIELLPGVENLQIPRWYSTKLTSQWNTKKELHIFVDAGDDAFSAAAYLRVENEDEVDCSLVGSKAKVTPLKYLSMPRKELMAAVLGSRLANSAANGLSLKINRRVIWSDSITVLTWLHSEHRKYSQFVAHRVGEVLENTNLAEWRWVPSKKNVADEATKWSRKPTFDASDRWFTGPQFLQCPESEWPKPRVVTPNGTTEEMKISCSHSRLITPSIVDARNFSTWQRLVRAIANAKRIAMWMVAKQRKLDRPKLKLSQEDLLESEKILVRQAQWEGFTEEMVTLTRNQLSNKKKPIDVGSSIKDCTPYLDDFGTLRVRGRIDSATAVTIDAKRPIILPKDNPITKLIVLSYHVKFKHRNHETVVNEVKQKFYIPRIRTVVRSVRWNCKLCALRRCKPQAPQIADLPAIRFEAGIRPFTYTGIDYFGPMKVKVGRQSHKRWGVIYTCLTMRGVYIDVVPSLDTEACILSIRDFINRRGVVQEFYTDNGTNFTGAKNELEKEILKIEFERLSDEFTTCYTKWKFNPPEAPHMGGMWERLIRSIKISLDDSMITRTPTDQMLRSWLIEAENIVNTRPLTFVPIESEDDEALTPNHFIIGSSNGLKPPGIFKGDGPYLRHQWKEVQRCADRFWKRFVHEYIPTLVRRTKWFDPVKPLQVGDLVINFDEDAPRNTYTRARVVDTIVGTNHQVRRAKVQFANGNTLWRPAHKLGLLDVNPSPDETNRSKGSDRQKDKHPTPTDEKGLDHQLDDINRGENVGVQNLPASSSSTSRHNGPISSVN